MKNNIIASKKFQITDSGLFVNICEEHNISYKIEDNTVCFESDSETETVFYDEDDIEINFYDRLMKLIPEGETALIYSVEGYMGDGVEVAQIIISNKGVTYQINDVII